MGWGLTDVGVCEGTLDGTLDDVDEGVEGVVACLCAVQPTRLNATAEMTTACLTDRSIKVCLLEFIIKVRSLREDACGRDG